VLAEGIQQQCRLLMLLYPTQIRQTRPDDADDAPTLGKRLKATKTEDYRAERRTLPGYGDTRVMQEIAKTDDFHLTSDALKAKTT